MSIQSRILKTWRERHKITQKELAEITKIPQPVISYIEQGERYPTEKHALAIEQATNGEIKKEWLVFPEAYKEEIEEYLKEKVGVASK